MSAPTCWFCERVKGKRSCPARGGSLICSRCCGSKRQVEIQCPEDCHFLHGADAHWKSTSQRKEEGRFLAPFFALGESRAALLFFLHHVLLSSPPTARLGDEDLEDVLAAAHRTLVTRAKGVLYTHAPVSASVEPLVDWLARVLVDRGKIAGAPEASDVELLEVMDVFTRAVGAYRARSPVERRESYLETSRRLLGVSLSQTPELELPPELELDGRDTGLILPP